jgi:hypothetical protein
MSQQTTTLRELRRNVFWAAVVLATVTLGAFAIMAVWSARAALA